MLDTFNISMAILALVLAICVLAVTILISGALRNGKSIHLLTAALIYACAVRVIVVTNCLDWTNIPTNALGPPTYFLLLLGFWSIYCGIKNIGKEKKEHWHFRWPFGKGENK
jgi:hypothetical protein